MPEFRAEDWGTPASVAVALRQLPRSRLALPAQASRAYNPATRPLEVAVEAQPQAIGPGLQLGQDWLRQVRTLSGFGALNATGQATALGL